MADVIFVVLTSRPHQLHQPRHRNDGPGLLIKGVKTSRPADHVLAT